MESEELKDMEEIKALKDEALEMSKTIRMKGGGNFEELKEKYNEMRKRYDVFFEKYNPLMPEFLKKIGA
jgi:exopolysaccharide biosynthesis predicted pyruvyltransferase EpsI